MQRRHIWLLVAGMLAVLANACADSADPAASSSTAAPEETAAPTSAPTESATSSPTTVPVATTIQIDLASPEYGGTAVIGDDQYPPTLNPYGPGGDNFIVSIIGQALHTGVYDIDAATLERIPEVVGELPTVANGGIVVNDDATMTVGYTIRDEAVWADGTPISGDDFAFTYETLTDPEIASATVAAFNDNPYDLIVAGSIESGPKTFRYTTMRPTLEHEQFFNWLIPRHQVEGTDVLNDWNEQPWLSGGPFVLDTWDPNEQITLVRNDSYWKSDPETGARLPWLDEVVFEFMPETESLLAAFKARELDVIQPPPFTGYFDDLQNLDGVELTIGHGVVWEHLNFQFGESNRNGDSLNRYVDYRRAVAHAIDRDAILELVQDGFGTKPLSSYLDTYTPSLSIGAWDRYEYNPERARELIAGLCAELGRDCEADPPRLIFSTTSNGDIRIRIADWLVDALAEVGIEVDLDLEDSQLYFGPTLEGGSWDVGLWAWVGGPGFRSAVSIHDVFDPEAPPQDGSNYYRWGTPATTGTYAQGPSTVSDDHTARFAEIVDAMRATVDETELTALLQEAEEILADQVVIIPLFSRLSVSAVWADEIGGFRHNPTQASHTWNIEEWFRIDL